MVMAAAWAAAPWPSRGQQPLGDGRLAHEAQSDAGKGDAQLAHGQVFVDVVMDMLDEAPRTGAFLASSTHLGAAHLDGGELRQHEEVRSGQEQDEQAHA
jgi:hypothetical protein